MFKFHHSIQQKCKPTVLREIWAQWLKFSRIYPVSKCLMFYLHFSHKRFQESGEILLVSNYHFIFFWRWVSHLNKIKLSASQFFHNTILASEAFPIENKKFPTKLLPLVRLYLGPLIKLWFNNSSQKVHWCIN